MSEKFSLKDLLFNEKKLIQIASQIKSAYKPFEEKKFILETSTEIKKLELKERIICIAKNLKKFLPPDYKTAANILIKSLPNPWDSVITSSYPNSYKKSKLVIILCKFFTMIIDVGEPKEIFFT